jgi:hypothetical protein
MHFPSIVSLRFCYTYTIFKIFPKCMYLSPCTVNSFEKLFKFNLILCKLGAKGHRKWNSLDCYYRSPLPHFIQTSAKIWYLKYVDWETDRQTVYAVFIHFDHCEQRIHKMLTRSYGYYMLIETLTSPLPTEGPEGVVLARWTYLIKAGITGWNSIAYLLLIITTAEYEYNV